MKRIYRNVDVVEESWRGQNGRLRLVLSCRHTQRRKYSQGAPSKARCLECEAVRSGSGGTTYDTTAKTKHWQEWDADKEMPIDRSSPMTGDEIAHWCRIRGSTSTRSAIK